MLDAFVLAATLAAASAPPLEPFPAPTPGPAFCDRQFKAFDRDQDGWLSYDEYVAGCWGLLRFVAAPTPAQAANHKRRYLETAILMDRDRDQRLSPAEHRRACQQARP